MVVRDFVVKGRSISRFASSMVGESAAKVRRNRREKRRERNRGAIFGLCLGDGDIAGGKFHTCSDVVICKRSD